jgi:ComF family protein
VLALKHGDRLDIAPLAGGWMLRAGADLVADADLIVPAPMHWLRLARRRFNQAGELARSVALAASKPHAFAPDLLQRVKATATQDGKKRAERMENVSGAFSVAPRWRGGVPGGRILLIDDVMTTGATLSECAGICLAAGAAEVNVLVMARVARSDWSI